ncbi:GNAT family N-acetyltransferase [Bavariicoccus seileri]|uniref:GNAT family N-acetyltransferase n=1 Tax=Bavariicoccus seileri TaxID=549685 RepID=UPI0003B641A0|nr:GNAT family N-acetyltransferase [Bavariicoccus seileri]
MKFSYKKEIKISQLLALYNTVGWTAYTREPDKLQKAIRQSLSVITVWDDSDNNSQLIGLIRGVGDGETILYIQDILVMPTFQNRGIGKQLMEQLLSMYPDVRQKVLLTEDAPDVRHFYEKCGFESADNGSTVAFYREY